MRSMTREYATHIYGKSNVHSNAVANTFKTVMWRQYTALCGMYRWIRDFRFAQEGDLLNTSKMEVVIKFIYSTRISQTSHKFTLKTKIIEGKL
jgi:hypothetical protein